MLIKLIATLGALTVAGSAMATPLAGQAGGGRFDRRADAASPPQVCGTRDPRRFPQDCARPPADRAQGGQLYYCYDGRQDECYDETGRRYYPRAAQAQQIAPAPARSPANHNCTKADLDRFAVGAIKIPESANNAEVRYVDFSNGSTLFYQPVSDAIRVASSGSNEVLYMFTIPRPFESVQSFVRFDRLVDHCPPGGESCEVFTYEDGVEISVLVESLGDETSISCTYIFL